MLVPKLTPLQSRFAASFAASLLLLLIYFFAFNPHFAYATDSIQPEDHNHLLLYGFDALEGDGGEAAASALGESDRYHPDFFGVNRGLVGRAPDNLVLRNNEPANMEVSTGESQHFDFRRVELFGECAPETPGLPPYFANGTRSGKYEAERSDCASQDGSSRLLYITINTCSQPARKDADDSEPPPQLRLFVSTSANIDTPGPDNSATEVLEVRLSQGYGVANVRASGDVFLGVTAPSPPTGFEGDYSYQLAASIDAPFHSYVDIDRNLFLVDSDSAAVLLITDNLTSAEPSDELYKQWTDLAPPFTLFAHDTNDTAIDGLEHSFCGLQRNAKMSTPIKPTEDTEKRQDGDDAPSAPPPDDGSKVTMTTRGLGEMPKQQFYLNGLQASASYTGILAMRGNSTADGGGVVGGGGTVWRAMNFTSKTDKNCALLYDLPFCSSIAYAVPSNPLLFPSPSSLVPIYDNYVASVYRNFSYALSQHPCNTTSSTAQYSLATNCTACAAAYKAWLCAVSIPRCADFSSPTSMAHLAPRNIGQDFVNGSSLSGAQLSTYVRRGFFDELGYDAPARQVAFLNASRNPRIDALVRPGPYKEVKPCVELCYGIVQNCPATLGFACPTGPSRDRSYGMRSPDGYVTCSYLGAAFFLSDAARGGVGWGGAAGWVSVVVVLAMGGLW
ncbi:MAG: stretch-activated cation channel mid1 [Piccolia ochrophora]|nr:MAG: stretch-activated cation channel mid1 [Piccolia ochrophora]